MFDADEIRAWERERQSAKACRPQRKKRKIPRIEKLKEVRKGVKAVHYHKECKACRKQDYRLYRRRMDRLLAAGQYERITNYKRTSGWMTW